MNYTKILLVEPDYFDVVDCRNPHMNPSISVDKTRAQNQWQKLVKIYRMLTARGDLGELILLGPHPSFVDLVFCANAGITWKDENNNKKAFMSSMRHRERRGEIPYVKSFLESEGFNTTDCDTGFFEGTGDCIWYPSSKKLFCGFGYRTDQAGLKCFKDHVKDENITVIDLELRDPRFYHLDTCFLPVNRETVLVYHKAFTPDAFAKITSHFKKVELIDEKEALNFALNGHIIRTLPKRKDVCIIQKGNPQTEKILKREKIRIVNCELDEFNKSGGSVFCMKLEFN
jgi:N-dimethylarginine dimethylaminohydrolase